MRKEPCSPQVGADIEHFVRTDEGIVPCVGIIPGTKDHPYTPPDYMEGFAMQEDNVMAEYNVPPSDCRYDFAESLAIAREMIDEQLPTTHWLEEGKSVHKFKHSQLLSEQAQVIGCEPDNDAWKNGAQRNFCGVLGTHRGCGGHIHLGGEFNCPDWVAALFADLVIGVHSLGIENVPTSRTEWYGMPGIFRSKPYGIEYRTPSNFWTVNRPSVVARNAIGLANYLTIEDAETIRADMRNINWPLVRDIMTPGHAAQKVRNWETLWANATGTSLVKYVRCHRPEYLEYPE